VKDKYNLLINKQKTDNLSLSRKLKNNKLYFSTTSLLSKDNIKTLCGPVARYINADTKKVRIIKENKGKSAVYCWVNKVNGYKYVGSSINLSKRLLQYFNTEYLLRHKNMVISRIEVELTKGGTLLFSSLEAKLIKAGTLLVKYEYVSIIGYMLLLGVTLISVIPWEYFISNCNDICLSIVPVFTYLNADSDKLSIINDNKGKSPSGGFILPLGGKSGIYQWVHKKTGKSYVGSAQDIGRRLRLYYIINHLTKNSGMYINRVLLKDGYASFSLYVLEYCDEKNLIKREQYYLDTLKPEYNILKIAGSPLGYKHTKESLVKMSISKAGEKNPILCLVSYIVEKLEQKWTQLK
jgi:GIY-YIG catalytic domain